MFKKGNTRTIYEVKVSKTERPVLFLCRPVAAYRCIKLQLMVAVLIRFSIVLSFSLAQPNSCVYSFNSQNG